MSLIKKQHPLRKLTQPTHLVSAPTNVHATVSIKMHNCPILFHACLPLHSLFLPGCLCPCFNPEKSNSPFKARFNYHFLYNQTLFSVLPLAFVHTSPVAFTIYHYIDLTIHCKPLDSIATVRWHTESRTSGYSA